MKAMILAAGLGTRLRPLTNTIPKALAPINDCPAIEYVIHFLKKNCVDEIIINLHYKGDQIRGFIKSKNNFNIKIEFSDESDNLLDTGGGLKKASWFFEQGEPFYLINSDIITEIDLIQALDFHNKQKGLATLITRPENSKRKLFIDENKCFCGLTGTETSDPIIFKGNESFLTNSTFSGIHIINPGLFKYFEEKEKFSIIDTYIKAGKDGASIFTYHEDKSFWIDIGTPEQLEKTREYFRQKNILCKGL